VGVDHGRLYRTMNVQRIDVRSPFARQRQTKMRQLVFVVGLGHV
jgi:hypothetical protein